jgi:AsmA protein
MHKITKYSLYAIGSVVVLLAASACYVATTFDANTLKPRIEAWVKAKQQRNLALNGPISVTFFPRFSITLRDVDLSERDSSSQFAHISNVKVTLRFLPLLTKKIMIDDLNVQGVTLNIVKDNTGVLNFADLTQIKRLQEINVMPAMLTDSDPSVETRFTTSGFQLSQFNLSNARITYRDLKSDQQFTLDDFALFGDALTFNSAGHIDLSARLQSNNPSIDLQVTTKLDQIKFDKADGQYVVSGVYNVIEGKHDKNVVKLTLMTPKITVNAQSANAELVSLSTSLNSDSSHNNKPTYPMTLSGKLVAQLNSEHISVAMKGSLEHDPLDFSADIIGFKKPDIRLDIKTPSQDLNHYISVLPKYYPDLTAIINGDKKSQMEIGMDAFLPNKKI